eukprot:5953083-Alexandrium_andersonii.AAC.1
MSNTRAIRSFRWPLQRKVRRDDSDGHRHARRSQVMVLACPGMQGLQCAAARSSWTIMRAHVQKVCTHAARCAHRLVPDSKQWRSTTLCTTALPQPDARS